MIQGCFSKSSSFSYENEEYGLNEIRERIDKELSENLITWNASSSGVEWSLVRSKSCIVLNTFLSAWMKKFYFLSFAMTLVFLAVALHKSAAEQAGYTAVWYCVGMLLMIAVFSVLQIFLVARTHSVSERVLVNNYRMVRLSEDTMDGRSVQ